MDKGKPPTAPKGAKKPVTPKTFQRPRGGEAKAVSALMPEIGRAAFRRFGFVSLPFMALCGFVSVVILLCTTYTKKSEVKETAQHMEKL
jgi:hypothetical protein